MDFGTGSYVHQPHTVYGEECLTEEYEPPHQCMTDLQYCGNGQIGGLVGTELWLSEPLKPHAFPEAYRYGHFNGKPIRFLCGERAGYILTDEYPAVIEMEIASFSSPFTPTLPNTTETVGQTQTDFTNPFTNAFNQINGELEPLQDIPKQSNRQKYQQQLAQAFGVQPEVNNGLPDYIGDLVRSIYDQT